MLSVAKDKVCLLIRVDANKDIALGHLKRCISLAIKLREMGSKITFVTTPDKFTTETLAGLGFDHIVINCPVNSDDDQRKTIDIGNKVKAGIILIDSYQLDARYRKGIIDSGFFTASIDDIADRDIPSHMIINGNLNAEALGYANDTNEFFCQGIEYLILGPDYWNIEPRFSGELDNVLITMGGIDHYDLTTKILSVLDKTKKNFDVTVIAGPYYENLRSIESQITSMGKKVTLVKSPPSLYPYIKKCDMAFSAGGQTLYELATLGVPTIGVMLWENQAGNVRELAKRQAIEGIIYSENDDFDGCLISLTERLTVNKGARESMSNKSRSLVDGNGANRTSSEMIKAYKQWDMMKTNKEKLCRQ